MADFDKTIVIDPNSQSQDKEVCPVCGMVLQEDPSQRGYLCCMACNFRKKQTIVLTPGSIVGNKYKLLNYLNSGGCGDLFLCCPLDDMSQRYVLKVMKSHDSASQSRFHREAVILSSIRNPRIAAVLDHWSTDTESYIIMEYIKGKNLKVVYDFYSIDEATALQLIQEVALALQYIWENFAIIHRDIKPENIMLNDDLQVKLLDFGLSKQVGSSTMTDVTSERTGLGTPGYMSPEQFLNSRDVDFRADIYSLGATLFFLLTGYKPINGTTNREVYEDTLKNSPPPALLLELKCSSECIDLIQFMMQAKVEDRPSSYGVLLERIARLLNRS